MENSKWLKIATKEEILSLRERKDFVFSTTSISIYFGIPLQRVNELLRYYNIEVDKLTKNKKLTTEQWVEECNEKHNGYFDYSMSDYLSGSKPIKIGCPIHGIINVNPNRHKNGSGCKRCSAKIYSIFKPLSKENFIKEATITHSGKYDYSLVGEFETVHEDTTIICPTHGEFTQRIHSHRKGSGCEDCSYIERGQNLAVSFSEFLGRAKSRFGDLYEYLEESYTIISENVTYICQIHGEMNQIASSHLISKGCSKCFGKNIKHTTESFTEKAKLTHLNFYSYDKSVYGSKNTVKLIITCPYHGDFKQAPMSHLAGSGCGTCANIKSNLGYRVLSIEDVENSKKVASTIYLLKFTTSEKEYYKVGISANLKTRCTKLKGSHRADVEVVFKIDTDLFTAASVEAKVLQEYKRYNKKGKVPYRVEGSTECLSIDTPIDELIARIKTLTKL